MHGARILVAAFIAAAAMASVGRAAGPEPTNTSPPVIVKVESDGFHWQDAGLGAAAALAAAFVVLGLVLTVRQAGGPTVIKGKGGRER